MNTRIDQHSVDESLEALRQRVLSRVPDDLATTAVGLATAAYRRVRRARLEMLDMDAIAAFLADAAAFMNSRKPGELALRVFNPSHEEHGWTVDRSIVEVNVEDGPFLVSTITEGLNAMGLQVIEVVHPVVGVERDEAGHVCEILPARHAARRECLIHLELDRLLGEEELETVEVSLQHVLDDALRATADFLQMKEQVGRVIERMRTTATAHYDDAEVAEAIDFLEWLLDDHFILLGYREYDLIDAGTGSDADSGSRVVEVRHSSGLGILSDTSMSTYAEPVPLDRLEPALRERVESGPLLMVSRTNRVSTVHRRQRMVYVGVKMVDADGRIVGEQRLLGLFAQKAYAEPSSATPVLRSKLQAILEREDVVDHSHDERIIRALFEAFPKHELFAADADALRGQIVDLLEAERQRDVRVLWRLDAAIRSASVLVSLPRDRFSTEVRERVQELLVERLQGGGVDYHLSLGERDQAIMHFVIHLARDAALDEVAAVDADKLERDITSLARTWRDDLHRELVERHGVAQADDMLDQWADRLLPSYTQSVPVDEAADDLAELCRVEQEASGVRMQVIRTRTSPDMRFKLYRSGAGVELSSFLPILESLGLVVVEEVPHLFEEAGDGEAHLHDFGVRCVGNATLDVDADGERLAEAALAAWAGKAEADSLNRLVLLAGLDWSQVAVLRAYRRYRRQVGTAFTEAYQAEALCEHPGIARAIIELFEVKFDPDRPDPDSGTHEDAIGQSRQHVLDRLEEVDRLDHDRILRGYLGMVEATTRTNRYRRPQRNWLSLKLDSSQVPGLPKPIPYAEIFVYSPEMEGIHLRGGPIARGGLRWSDRLEDFRTEVLGLMQAQMVKNAIIVPTGSKGGFVLKHAPSGGDALRAEVRRQYETFVRGMLDVTDNVTDGGVKPPERVRRTDGDDPYLVVAADRGTATFSDLANAISEEYGYWLGDAFASGGSSGYDHKAMGITARGAWVAVQRHFRELGVDVQTEPIDIVGIGDMSGDVFGNGLLRSRAVRLLAAFDHRDVFIDPDPEPVVSFEERARLYEQSTSSWQDYDRALISDGGGVWSRAVKSIPLSEAVRKLLRADAEEMSPPELVRGLLTAPVDLLFAGGIGTFVKASSQSNAEVGDRANDAVRVDADRVGARVIGEGGNLSVTQQGRVQYARRGGRINLDAIDNSAGVDTSDREVNLKILLEQAVAAGEIDREERDRVIADVREDVAERVLRDVYLQTWALSQEVAFSPGGMEAYEQLMSDFVEAGRLDREVEALPSTDEMTRRREAGAGLTRPELALLLGYAKLDVFTRLMGSDIVDEPALRPLLRGYFPERITDRFGPWVTDHRLRRELVATLLANDLVNRMGVTYVSRTAHELGCLATDVAGAYWVAREVTFADELWRVVEGLDGLMDPGLQLELKREIDRLVDACARAYIRQGATSNLDEVIGRDREAFERLEKVVAGELPPARQAARRNQVERFVDAGVDPEIAERIVGRADLALVPDAAAVARRLDDEVDNVADAFLTISRELPLDRLHARLQDAEPEGHWERWQHRGLVDELRHLRRSGAARAIADHPGVPGEEAVERFLTERADSRRRADALMQMLDADDTASLAAISVVVGAVRSVVFN